MGAKTRERHLFDVPICRCNLDQHTEEMAQEKSKYIQSLKEHRETPPESSTNAEKWFDDNRWYPWRFNEIVGWIHLYLRGSQVRGELYFLRSESAGGDVNKRFYWVGRIFELHCHADDSSATIYNAICAELIRFQNEPQCKERYLDLEAFREMGPFINWRKLVKT